MSGRRRGLVAVLGLALATAALGGCGSGSSSDSTGAGGATAGSGGTTTAAKTAPKPAPKGSIQGYGAAATGADKAAVVAAVHGFLTAMANGDDAGMCAHLSVANRKQLEDFGQSAGGAGGCAGALGAVLSPAVQGEARTAAAAPVGAVRVKGGNALVIFTPKGGSASYLAMKREGGGWRAISVTPGTPLEPSANP